jgi:hypothetical protein
VQFENENPVVGAWVSLIGVGLYLIAGFLPYFQYAGPSGSNLRPIFGGTGGSMAIEVRILTVFQWVWPVALIAIVGLRSALRKRTSRQALVGACLIAGAELVSLYLVWAAQSDVLAGNVGAGFWLMSLAMTLMLIGCATQLRTVQARQPNQS